ncbi:uncharacterized protein N7498_000557 [Penicillium cinerascens]|uniref:Uncharacterized protein n=1 Tax=Penicillium cinerascens TaxID=70096 RepID=A0A9W9NES5_9EURO|nr:uncharacterized protein N7498_000557 [Penicillium cinerascens]KAJ5218458.1 hypothetical protein N7498_000557 [Penicillium cinerascens]
MPSATGILKKNEEGAIRGQFAVDGSTYFFVGTLLTPISSFGISNARIIYDSTEQLAEQPVMFEEIPIRKDQIELKLQNGVEVSGFFDQPFGDDDVNDQTFVTGGAAWMQMES